MTKRVDFLRSLEIEDIRLRSIKVMTRDELYSIEESLPLKIKYRWGRKRREFEDQFKTSVILEVIINISKEKTHSENSKIFELYCAIEAVYCHKLELDKKLYNNLKKNLFVIHFWPYVRELISNISNRLGIDTIVLPPLGQLVSDEE